MKVNAPTGPALDAVQALHAFEAQQSARMLADHAHSRFLRAGVGTQTGRRAEERYEIYVTMEEAWTNVLRVYLRGQASAEVQGKR